MKRLVVMFAAEATRDGKSLGKETRLRIDRLVDYLRSNPRTEALIASQAIGFDGESIYSRLVKDELSRRDISLNRIHSQGYTKRTLDEITIAESFFSTHRGFGNLVVITTWYHVARVKYLWWRNYPERKIQCIGVLANNPYIWYRAILEIPKLFLSCTPTKLQNSVSLVFRKLKLH